MHEMNLQEAPFRMIKNKTKTIELRLYDSQDNLIDVDGNTSIELPARTSKKVYYKVKNTNKGVVKYGVGYSGTDVEAKVYEDTKDAETGLIDYMGNKFVKLKLINNGTK